VWKQLESARPTTGILKKKNFDEVKEEDKMFLPYRYKPDKRICCTYHNDDVGNTRKIPLVVDFYRQCWRYVVQRLMGAPMLFLGEKVIINEENIRVEGDKIYVADGSGRKHALAPINFAACWNGDEYPAQYVGVEATVGTPRFLIPPIVFQEHPRGYKLVLEFFRNGWMVQVSPKQTIPIPNSDGCDEHFPYLNAINSRLRKEYKDCAFARKRQLRIRHKDSDGEENEELVKSINWSAGRAVGLGYSSGSDASEEEEEEEEEDEEEFSD